MAAKELLNKDDFLFYIKKSKISILIIIFFILLTFGQRLITNNFSMDTEFYINNFQGIYNAFDSLGRPSLKIINQVLGITYLVPYFNTFLTIFFIFIYSLLFNYLFYINIGKKYKDSFLKFQFIFPIIFFTNPIFAEQYNFIFQSVGVTIGIVLIPISLLLIELAMQAKNQKKKYLLLFLSIVIAGFSFGVYQSIITLFIQSIVCVYFIKTGFSGRLIDNNWKYLLLGILTFIGSLIIYFLFSEYTRTTNSYLQLCWGQQEIGICIRNIYYVLLEALNCQGMFYNISYIISLIFLGLIVLYKLISEKFNLEFIISVIGLILSPFYIMIATGVDQLHRAQFSYSFFIAFIFLFFSIIIKRRNSLTKTFCIIIALLAIAISYKQAYYSAKLFYSDEIRYQNDITIGNKIQTIIESKNQYNPDKTYTLIFIGGYDKKTSSFLQKGEVMGYSFFEFDYPYIYGPSQRANSFMKTLGYNYKRPSLEQFNESKIFVEENQVPPYPAIQSVIILEDDIIIVRLSEEIN